VHADLGAKSIGEQESKPEIVFTQSSEEHLEKGAWGNIPSSKYL
jgi:hypothetical protein